MAITTLVFLRAYTPNHVICRFSQRSATAFISASVNSIIGLSIDFDSVIFAFVMEELTE